MSDNATPTPAGAAGAAPELDHAGGQPAAKAPPKKQPAPKQPAAADVDPDEAEYQAKMAEIRAERERAQAELEQEADEEDAEDGDGEDPAEDEEGDQKKPASKVKKYKVNGKEVEVDLGDEAKVDQLVQKGLAADERFQRAAKVEQQAKNFIAGLKSNPFAVLAHPQMLGKEEARKQAELFLFKEIQREGMSKEQLAQIEEKEELERFRQEKAQREERDKQANRERAKEDARRALSKQFVDALEVAGVPKNDWTVMRMAQYLKQAREKGLKHYKPSDVVELVQRDWKNALHQMIGAADGDKLIQLLGEDAAKKIRKADVARFKQGQGQRSTTPAPRESSSSSGPTYSSAEEMRDALAQRRRRA
jgi:hypothetical protein